MSHTPLCDAVLSTPIGVPPGLESALRGVERDARHARDGLLALAAAGDAVPAVDVALARLDAFLDDRRRSPLLRALRRPLRQIALGTPAWRRLESAWRAAVIQAAAATRLQRAVVELRADLARVTARFGAAMPYWTALILVRHRVALTDVESLRRDDGKKPLAERLSRAEAELERLARHLPPPETLEAFQSAKDWPGGVTPGELLAAASLALLHRPPEPASAGVAVRLRAAAARQLHALGTAAGWKRGRTGAGHSVAEQLANAALAVRDEVGLIDDAPLWTGMMEASADGVYAPGRAGAWQAQLAPPRAADDETVDWGATHFVLPISPHHALVTPEHPSAVRVASRRVAVGAALECAVFAGGEAFETVERAHSEVAPLFTGLGDGPAWYRNERRAVLTVIGRAGARWLARVDRVGELLPVDAPAWRATAPREARLRVLLDGTVPSAAPVPVGAARAEVTELGGVELRVVDAPFARVRRAWLKTAANGDDEARVEAEHAFFRRLAARLDGAGLRLLGRGRLERPAAEGPLYVPPFALALHDSPPLARWAAAAPVDLLCAVARLSVRLWAAGLALGLYHRAALAFRVEWTPGGILRPLPVITAAPFAAAMGEPRPELGGAGVAPEFPGLGVRVLPHALASGFPATPGTEAQAFVLFALDLLAKQKLRSRVRTLDGVARVAAENADDYFGDPDGAMHFVRALTDPRRSLAIVQSLARAGEDTH